MAGGGGWDWHHRPRRVRGGLCCKVLGQWHRTVGGVAGVGRLGSPRRISHERHLGSAFKPGGACLAVHELSCASQVTAALAVNKPDAFDPADAPGYIGAQMAGATAAGLLNYGFWRHGIRTLELKENITRGSKNSASVYHGAFGMVPNTALIKSPLSALALETWATGTCATISNA